MNKRYYYLAFFVVLTINYSVLAQDGLIKTIRKFDAGIVQHTYMNNKLIFSEIQTKHRPHPPVFLPLPCIRLLAFTDFTKGLPIIKIAL
jgi:hypothetical protein